MVTKTGFKILIQVTHLPTSRFFEYYVHYSMSGNEALHIKDLMRSVGNSSNEGFTISNSNVGNVFFPPSVCKDCVFFIGQPEKTS